ncbi:MAG: glycosyltransferase family 2 protein [Candidatus Riflebacteria bacterium]|nr:glycosyltransferase family 2 protein [Candidatus Riflebacteria bacterium]
MTAPALSVSVIVLNWNGADHLAPCLESVRRLTFPRRDLWLVDNASQDDSADRAERDFPEIGLIRNSTNLGYAGGNNVGFRSTRGDLVLLVNNDTVLDPDAVEPLVESFERDPDLASGAPRLLYYDRPDVINSAGLEIRADCQPSSRGMGQPDGERFREPTEVFGAHGACVMYRRSALERVGVFDEEFFAYNEEFDLAWRLRLAGYRAGYVPASRVLHREAMSLRQRPDRILYLMERNRIWAMVKNLGWGTLVRRLPRLLLAEVQALRHCVGIRTAVPLRARWDALKGLPGMLGKRRRVQGLRVVPDRAIERWMLV